MADTKVSALTAATTINDTDELPIVQSGSSLKATVARINKKVTNGAVASQTLTASTLTNITGSNLAIPTGVTITTDTLLQWKIMLSKTAAGTAANVFHVRCGTTGTTADTAVLTFTTSIGTAAVDSARIDLMVSPRSVGASGVIQGGFQMTHNLSATGFLNIAGNSFNVTSAAFNTTTANLIWTVSATTGASAVITVQMMQAEATGV